MDAVSTSNPACPVCATAESVRIGRLPDNNLFAGAFLDRTLSGGFLYRCERCRLKFRYPVEDTGVYDALYDNQDTLTWPADPERPDWDLIADYVTEQRERGSVLDFGCYTGGLLARLGDAFELHGVEINRAAAEQAATVAAGGVYASLDEIPRERRFDVVVACDVVEHMVDPARTIGQLASHLSDDGILIVTTGDGDNRLWNRFGANWWYCFYPEHVSFISKAWLEYVCEDLDMSLRHCETFRYCSLRPAQVPFHVALTYAYGWFPGAYLRLRRLLDRARGRPGTSSVTGVGVSDDHLFAVLGKAAGERT